jgi:hypothetical protein
VAVDPNIEQLLARLSNVKRLPAPSQPFRTAAAASGSQVRDTALNAFQSTPRLSDAIQNIQQGGSAQTGASGALARIVGSPLGKVALGGLNIIDMPRRAIASGLKETIDLLDTDPNTKASFGDLRTQFNDQSFGFGRIAPGKGWTGRIVGFIGDVALDPLTYVTLGGTVAAKAVAKGAGAAGLRATAKVGAQDVALRAALGTKNVTGREGRFALANLAKQYGATADELAAIAARGKSAVPEDIAKVMGLQRNGLYMFGSRVRIPGSGRIGGALEAGLVKSRLGITNTNMGKKLQYLYTPKGASGTGGALNVRRADMASGRVAAKDVDLAITSLNGAENGRRRGASFGQQYLREARAVAILKEVQEYDTQIHRFIESGNTQNLSPSQRTAVEAVQNHFERVRILLENEGKRIDPSFTLKVGASNADGTPRYIPHIQTPEMYRWRQRNANSPWFQKLETQTSVDVLDMNNNLASRHFKAGDKFLETEDVIQTGSIDELNELWRKHSGEKFDMFETSTQRILAGYEQTVRGGVEAFTLLDDLKVNDFVRLLRSQGEVDPDYLKAMEKLASQRIAAVSKASVQARTSANELTKVVKQLFDDARRGTTASAVARQVSDVKKDIRVLQRQVTAGTAASARVSVLREQLEGLVLEQQQKLAVLGEMFDENAAVMLYMGDALTRSVDDGYELIKQSRVLQQKIDDANVSSEELEGLLKAFEQKSKDAESAFDSAQKTLEFYRMYGDELGPALESVFERIRLADSDMDVYKSVDDDIAEQLYSGDTRVNDILKILMRPFDNTPYQNTKDLGTDWIVETFGDAGDAGKLLRSIPDIGDPKGGRSQRSRMATNARKLSGADVNRIVGRASTVGDNHAEMADAFFFMTARELRSAYDLVGGGDAGKAAQAALAKELAEGASERSRYWLQARDAVNTTVEQLEVVKLLGSRRTARGGKYQITESARMEIDDLRAQRQQIESLGFPPSLSASMTSARGLVEGFVSGDPRTSLQVLDSFQRVLDDAVLLDSSLDGGDIEGLRRGLAEAKNRLLGGELSSKYNLEAAFKGIEKFLEDSFKPTQEIKRINQRIAKLQAEPGVKGAMDLDKNYNQANMQFVESTQDAGMKLSNYHIIHATRLAVDAIVAITPHDKAPGEALYAFARSGAARQQLKHVTDYRKTISSAEEILSRMELEVMGTITGGSGTADRAMAMRNFVAGLSDEERKDLFDVVGDLSFVQKQLAVSNRLGRVRKNTPEYTSVRDEIWSLSTEQRDWRSAIQAKNYARSPSRVRQYSDYKDASMFDEPDFYSNQRGLEPEESMFAEREYDPSTTPAGSEFVTEQTNVNNMINSMESASPKTLNKEIQKLLDNGMVDEEYAAELRAGVAAGEEAAKRNQKAARVAAGTTAKGERKAKQVAKGVVLSGDNSFGMGRLFHLATKVDKEGSTVSNQRILDFFTYVRGDGKVRRSNSGGFKRARNETDINETSFEGEDFSLGSTARKAGGEDGGLEEGRGISEAAYREEIQGIIASARKRRQEADASLDGRRLTSEQKKEAKRANRIAFYRSLGSEGENIIDENRALKLLDENDRLLVTKSYLKADIKAKRRILSEGSIDAVRETEIRDSLADLDKQLFRLEETLRQTTRKLTELETDAAQLVTRGTSSPVQEFDYISMGDSVLGKAKNRNQMRQSLLGVLSRDVEAGDAFTLESGLRQSEVLGGVFGYVEFLRGRQTELSAAVDTVERLQSSSATLRKGVNRKNKAARQQINDAELIANNPRLAKAVDAAIEINSDDPAVRAAAQRTLVVGTPSRRFLGASRLAGPKGTVPARVSSLVNDQRKLSQELNRLQSRPEFTAALERAQRNEFILALAEINLVGAKALDFPEGTYSADTDGFLRRWTALNFPNEQIDATAPRLFATKEVDLESLTGDLLNPNKDGNKALNTVFVSGDLQIPRHRVRDSILRKNNSKFKYVAEGLEVQSPAGKKVTRLVYNDKTTGEVFYAKTKNDLGEIVDEEVSAGFQPRELVLDEPVYLSIPDSTSQAMAEQYNAALSGRVQALKKVSQVTQAKDHNLFNPMSTHAFMPSPKGERVYRMDAIPSALAEQDNPLHPRNIFSPKFLENFDSLFAEPLFVGSAAARKLRSDLADASSRLRAKQVEHATHLDALNTAPTQKAYRASQRKAILAAEVMETLEDEVADLKRQIDLSNPALRMQLVKEVFEVMERFKKEPELLRRLGVKVTSEEANDAQAINGIKRYVAGLENARITDPANKSVENTVLTGGSYTVRNVDPVTKKRIRGEAYAGPEVAKKRKKFLRDSFRNSPENRILVEHDKVSKTIAANTKELTTVKNGGEQANTVAALRAVTEDLDRSVRQLGVAEKDVARALKKGKKTVAEGESLVDAAGRVVGEESERLSRVPVSDMGRIAKEGEEVAQFDADAAAAGLLDVEIAQSGTAQGYLNVRARVKSYEKNLGDLKQTEQTILKRIEAIRSAMNNKVLDRGQQALLGDELKGLYRQLRGVPGKKGLQQNIAAAQKQIDELRKTQTTLEANIMQESSIAEVGYNAGLSLDDAHARLNMLQTALEDMKSLRNRIKVGKQKGDAWQVDFDEFSFELLDMVHRLNYLKDGPDTRRLVGVLTGYAEAKANLLRVTAQSNTDNQISRIFAMDALVYKDVIEDGWLKLSGSGSLKSFENLQMLPEVKEILSNMGRLTDGAFVKQMNTWFGPYTRFFKAWALSTPGYHVRNSVTNAFMLIAAGGRIQYLSDGMREYDSLYRYLKQGTPSERTIEAYLATLPPERARRVGQAYDAMLGSGVGQSEEVAFDTAGVLTNNPITRFNRKVGVWVEQHSRFMLAYDGIRQGLDVNGATARTRKFLFDYEDISNLDQKMRTIIPFWMWTSRNLPLTIQNIYMNPRPYQFYQNLRRNIEDEEKTSKLPKYMREAGGFGLAGTDFAATPDLGFNRMQADVNMLTSPTRFAANITPALRLPAELLANKSFFRNSEFRQQPTQVDGPVGNLAALLGAPLGMSSRQGGKQFVDERVLYGLTNAAPLLAQAERFLPSQEYYQQRGSTNPLLGYFGAPVRQVTPDMKASEQRRLVAELRKLTASQPKVTPDE